MLKKWKGRPCAREGRHQHHAIDRQSLLVLLVIFMTITPTDSGGLQDKRPAGTAASTRNNATDGTAYVVVSMDSKASFASIRRWSTWVL